MNKKNTKKGLRAVYYIRESTEEQDKGYSPASQKRSLEEYIKKNDLDLVGTYKDLKSGTSAKDRVEFQKMISDAMEHKFDKVLVYHSSRFSRNVEESRHYKKLLRKELGIELIYMTQTFGDDDDPSTFLSEGISELMDEHVSRQISFWVRKGLAEKRKQGLQTGNPPLGYYKEKIGFDEESGRTLYKKEWSVDQKEKALVKKIFTLYSTGRYSYADVAVEINKTGAKTKLENPFTYSSIKDILANKTYLGLVHSPRKSLPDIKGVHESIISKKIFDKVQTVIDERRNTKGRPVAQYRFYLLQGLVFCYHCRKHLKGKKGDNPHEKLLPKMYCQSIKERNGKSKKVYACKFRREYKSCKQKNIECKIIDKQVMDFMRGFKLPDDIIEMTLDNLGKLFEGTKTPDKVANEIKKLKKKEKKLEYRYMELDDITDKQYKEGLEEIKKELKKHKDSGDVKKNKITEKYIIKETEKFLRDFGKLWDSKIGDEEKRAWIQMTVKRVWVKDKKVVGIEPREDFRELFSVHSKVMGQVPLATPKGISRTKKSPTGGFCFIKKYYVIMCLIY